MVVHLGDITSLNIGGLRDERHLERELKMRKKEAKWMLTYD